MNTHSDTSRDTPSRESPLTLQIKICCIASPNEARLAIGCGADAIGLVSAMPSGPGPIDESLIAEIARDVARPTQTFLLTSLVDVDSIISQHRRCGTTTIQLTDYLDTRDYSRLRDALPGVALVQVVHVESAESFDIAAACAPHVNTLLLDSGRPGAPVKELGGTGRTHDWSISARIVRELDVPVFLAGGLRAENVAEAIAAVSPFGVDICSGVRSNGRLDENKLRAFVVAARR